MSEAQQLIEHVKALASHESSYSEFYFGDMFHGVNWAFEKPIKVEEFGGEGQGNSSYAVYHFPESDVYLRIDGFYQSYDGFYFDSPPYEVRPKQKTITVFE